jgi:hypothetical protein
MSIDPRPEIAKSGLAKLKELREEATPRINQAAAKLITEKFKPFLEMLRSVMDAAQGAEPAPRATPPPPAAEVSRADLQKLVERSPTVRRLRRELTVANGRLGKEMGRLQALEARVPALEKELRDAQAELSQIREGFQTALSERVEDLFEQRLGALFRRSSTVKLTDANAVGSPGRGAIATARRVLEAQALEDAQHGTRTALGRELEESKALRDALIEARLEALRPLPEIQQAVSALDRLIGDLETRLGVTRLVPRQSSDPIKRFVSEVRAARTISEIAQKRTQLEAIRISNQWSSEEISVAEEALSTAALQHYEGYLDDRSPRDADLLANASPLYALRVALVKGSQVRVIIDGHNVLHQMRPAWGLHFEEGRPGARAREYLANLLTELCEVHPGASIDLWFDSGVRQQETVSSRMRIFYSGGDGADRADKAISQALQHITMHRPSSTQRRGARRDLFVVSADRDVRSSAVRFRALAMYPTELAAVLGG